MIKKHTTFAQTVRSSVHPLSESSVLSPFSLRSPMAKNARSGLIGQRLQVWAGHVYVS